jgi:hypothetical protein
MIKRFVGWFIVSLLVVLVGTQVFAEEGKKVTKDQVPKAVIVAFEKAYPKATVKEYEQKAKGKEIWYEIEYTDGAVTREVKYKADGTLVGTEEDIAVKDLPDVVSKAFAAKYPGVKMEVAEKATQGDVVTYEVSFKVKGKEQEVKFSDKGEVIPKKEHKD